MEALEWDSNPDAHRFADGALSAILASHPELTDAKSRGTVKTEGLDVLEIGCGTGILTVRMAPYVRSIIAIDTAHDMIDTLRAKITKHGGKRSNITPIRLFLKDSEDPALSLGVEGRCMKFDLVISHLVLHHVMDHGSLLHTMYSCLKPNGQVALTDFEDFGLDARRFHPEGKMSDVEHQYGIKAESFTSLMREAGFEDVRVAPAWTMKKEVENYPGEWGPKGLGKPKGEEVVVETVDFPFLLCQGTRGCRIPHEDSRKPRNL